MLYHLSSLQTEEVLKKAREKLEFLRDVMMIPRNLAGEIRLSLVSVLVWNITSPNSNNPILCVMYTSSCSFLCSTYIIIILLYLTLYM